MTRQIKVGNVLIGGGAPVSIQSMTNTKTENVFETLNQIEKLYNAGCDVVRVAVLGMEAVRALYKIKEKSPIPIVADIHFDYKLAIESCYAGVDKIRINPGNIGNEDRVRAVVNACKQRNIPIRIGVNGGSLEKKLLSKYNGLTSDAVVESALNQAKMLEKYDFNDICISLKMSNVKNTIEAYTKASQLCDYPLHVGVTEAGTEYAGTVKSAIGIGSLLCNGIGDTIRVSLTADPVREVIAAKEILKSVGIYKEGINIISCPTCGRTKVDLIRLVSEVESRIKDINRPLTVAIMGCAVNGPGEAASADIGIACGDDCGLIFKKGEIVEKVSQEELVEKLLKYINDMLGEI